MFERQLDRWLTTSDNVGDGEHRAVGEEEFSTLLDALTLRKAEIRAENLAKQFPVRNISSIVDSEDKALLEALNVINNIDYKHLDDRLKKKIDEMSDEDFADQLEQYFKA